MRRLSMILVLALAATVWPAAAGAAGSAGAAQATGSLQADFDNDGFADVAVGVAEEDIGNLDGAGAVNVLYGSAGGLTGAGSQLLSQGAAGVAGTAEGGDGFGQALAAGDFDNDGFADLAVGVFGEGVGAVVGAGAVNVLYGSPRGLIGAGSQLFWQGAAGVAGTPEAFDLFGSALSAGDFDNDGFADLAVAAPLEDVGSSEDAGAVNVLYGSSGGLTGAGGQLLVQGAGGTAGNAEAGDQLGSALAAGDFDNDGAGDLAIGVPTEAVGSIAAAGAVDVLYGSDRGLTGTGSQLFSQGAAGGVAGNAENGDLFGRELASGDYDSNGASDLAVGVSAEDIGAIRDAGAVNLLYASAGGLSGAGSRVFRQGAGVAGIPEEQDLFGWAVSAGDFDNDGVADLAVGVLLEDIGGVLDTGALQVVYGTGAGLSETGNQVFWQGAAGVAGNPETDDQFGSALVGSDQPTGSGRAAAPRSRP